LRRPRDVGRPQNPARRDARRTDNPKRFAGSKCVPLALHDLSHRFPGLQRLRERVAALFVSTRTTRLRQCMRMPKLRQDGGNRGSKTRASACSDSPAKPNSATYQSPVSAAICTPPTLLPAVPATSVAALRLHCRLVARPNLVHPPSVHLQHLEAPAREYHPVADLWHSPQQRKQKSG
jgi:hypothetical protein